MKSKTYNLYVVTIWTSDDMQHAQFQVEVPFELMRNPIDAPRRLLHAVMEEVHELTADDMRRWKMLSGDSSQPNVVIATFRMPMRPSDASAESTAVLIAKHVSSETRAEEAA